MTPQSIYRLRTEGQKDRIKHHSISPAVHSVQGISLHVGSPCQRSNGEVQSNEEKRLFGPIKAGYGAARLQRFSPNPK